MKSNNTCNSLTPHSCCHQYLLEGRSSRYTGARVIGPKNIIAITTKLAIGSKRHDVCG
jgi:hypothetical protein